jgi:hypothetical protein
MECLVGSVEELIITKHQDWGSTNFLLFGNWLTQIPRILVCEIKHHSWQGSRVHQNLHAVSVLRPFGSRARNENDAMIVGFFK